MNESGGSGEERSAEGGLPFGDGRNGRGLLCDQWVAGSLHRGGEPLARRAVQAAPAHAHYHSVLGDALRESGEPAGADLEYERAARLSSVPHDRATILPPNPYISGS